MFGQSSDFNSFYNEEKQLDQWFVELMYYKPRR